MSGQQVGSVVGAVVGSFIPVIGTQLGAVIGGILGGWIAPTQITGPKLTDGMAVTAQDGIANPWGFGTFPVGCNIIWTADIVEHADTDDGKGSGQEVTTFRYTRSYAVGICRGNRASDGTYTAIAGILRATKNGKVVYDTSPDAPAGMQAQNAKFLENHTFYLGSEGQLADPTIESYLGAGNAPAYPGQVYMVAEDDETTRGEVAQWEFVVAMGGTVSPASIETLLPGRLSEFTNAHWPLVDDDDDYEYQGYLGSGGDPYTGSSIEDVISHFSAISGRPLDKYLGYSASTNSIVTPTVGLDVSLFGVDNVNTQEEVTDNEAVVLVYNDYEPDLTVDQVLLDDVCPITPFGTYIQSRRGKVSTRFSTVQEEPWSLDVQCDAENFIYGLFPLCIRVTRKRIAPEAEPPTGGVFLPDASGFYVMPDGTVGYIGNIEAVSGTYKVLNSAPAATEVDDRDQYPYYENGPALASDDENYSSQSYWEGQYAEAEAAGLVPSGWEYPADYPAVVTQVWKSAPPDLETIDPTQVLLSSIVAECCYRSGLTSDDIDVSQLTDTMDGFKVASLNMTGESIIQSLMPGYFFDACEVDDKLVFVKRGGAPTFELTIDDLAEREGDALEEIQAQEVELLRKVHVKSMDPAAGYVVTTQTAERRTSTVAAKGEQVIEIPVVTDHDTAAQMAHKRMKAAWGEPRRFKYTLPYTRPDITPTDVGTITDKKGRVQMIRVERASEDEGRIETEASLNRQAAYTSNVSGVPALPPVDTSPGLAGPTLGWVGNLPSLRTSDNVPGVYVGGRGYLSAWGGYALFLSADGGESYQRIGDYTKPTQIGNLTGDITASGEPIPVFMPQGTLSTITDTQLANRGNAFAITTDGESEIGQFQTATLGDPSEYDLTDTVRELLGTDAATHETGDPFVMLAGTHFVPLDISLSGKSLLFKFVSFGTSLDDTDPYPFTFDPKFTSVTVEAYTDDAGNNYTDDAGNTYYYEVSA